RAVGARMVPPRPPAVPDGHPRHPLPPGAVDPALASRPPRPRPVARGVLGPRGARAARAVRDRGDAARPGAGPLPPPARVAPGRALRGAAAAHLPGLRPAAVPLRALRGGDRADAAHGLRRAHPPDAGPARPVFRRATEARQRAVRRVPLAVRARAVPPGLRL